MARRKKATRPQRAPESKRKYRVVRNDPRALEIQAVLEDDLANHSASLMQPEYREYALDEQVLDGYCAAAAAAYFHLEPGDPRAAGLQPMQASHATGSHWWIVRRGEQEDEVIDLTLRKSEKPTFDYSGGRPRGFTNAGYKKPPPARAAKIIARVQRRRRTA